MKKIIILAMTLILAVSEVMPVMAAEEDNYLSVYDEEGDIRVYHLLEDSTESDFYSAFFDEDDYRVYSDCSTSMQQTFFYEKSKIIKNLSPFLNEKEMEIKDVFKNKKTDLYGLMASYKDMSIEERSITPIIITDLWDTECEDMENSITGTIVFCVPYASTNKEGIVHCEKVVNDILWYNDAELIYVVYTDEVIIRYCAAYHSDKGWIEIYVP